MHAAEELEPPPYEDCATRGTPTLTIDIKDTRIYSPAHGRRRAPYRITSSLNRDFVKGGFGLARAHPFKPGGEEREEREEREEHGEQVYDVRAVGAARFRLTGVEQAVCRVVTCQRKFGFSGHFWEVRQLAVGADPRHEEGKGVMRLTAKRTSREDGTLRWRDGGGRLLATDTRLVRGRGNHENSFQMPVLTVVKEVEKETLDLLVAVWLAKVWVEVVNAKKKTLMDAAYL